YQNCKDKSIFTKEFLKCLYTIIDTFILEQKHFENSTYQFQRDMAKVWGLEKTETLQNHGKGMPVNYTGMTWSGFRPSDDACRFHYNIPGNMFISVTLSYIQEFARDIYQDDILFEKAKSLQFEIDYGIELYGIVEHIRYGKIYAYETDGYGNHCLMDDANVPSLLSLPYLGYLRKEDPLYQNTRKFILSIDNPYYYQGEKLSGIGSPHTWVGYVWPIALSMQGLTSTSREEMLECIDMIVSTTGDTLYCHESIECNDDTKYTRPWFCWANSLFCELVIKAYF
ncbi:MAG: glycoside hydrolase family 125 protein, partial [Coprobacillus sp.]